MLILNFLKFMSTCNMPKPCFDIRFPVARKYSIELVTGDSRLQASTKLIF